MSGKHELTVRPAHVRRCVDEVAYLVYFDPDSQIGFEWTGRFVDPIEVSHGGFGEPITNLVTHTPNGRQNLRQYFVTAGYEVGGLGGVQAFQDLCRTWLVAIKLPGAWGTEPLRVDEVPRG